MRIEPAAGWRKKKENTNERDVSPGRVYLLPCPIQVCAADPHATCKKHPTRHTITAPLRLRLFLPAPAHAPSESGRARSEDPTSRRSSLPRISFPTPTRLFHRHATGTYDDTLAWRMSSPALRPVRRNIRMIPMTNWLSECIDPKASVREEKRREWRRKGTSVLITKTILRSRMI